MFLPSRYFLPKTLLLLVLVSFTIQHEKKLTISGSVPGVEPAWDSPSPSLSTPPLPALSLEINKINLKKKNPSSVSHLFSKCWNIYIWELSCYIFPQVIIQ